MILFKQTQGRVYVPRTRSSQCSGWGCAKDPNILAKWRKSFSLRYYLNKYKGEFMCRELAALNAVDGAVQRILLSGVKVSLYDTKQTQG